MSESLSKYGLEHHGLNHANEVYWSLPAPALVEHVARRAEGLISDSGAIVVRTGSHTGRAPKDKFVVRQGASAEQVWWGSVNQPFDPGRFEALHARVASYLDSKPLYVQDLAVGAFPEFRIPIRVVSESAWHTLFARNLFLRPEAESLSDHVPEFTVLHAPGFMADPKRDGTHSEVFIVLNFERGLGLIGGTSYAGEIKKSLFTVMNYRLPLQGVLSMHCSANQGPAGDTALFFGLSGTGKTTLSSDPVRRLIGDDEHGWSDQGVFNFEGGCYAKTIRLSAKYEPVIWEAVHDFGTVLENVVIDESSRQVDLDDDSLTENTRAGYSIESVDNYVAEGSGNHPRTVFFLTADASGVLPPISRLTPDQAKYYFLAGYTSKLAGTEKGLGEEPQATFSACFGEPFLALHPTRYADLLSEKVSRHQAAVWLVNTGWTGGPFGTGHRMELPYTRAMVAAAIEGELEQVPTRTEPFFGLKIPVRCPQVPDNVLNPQATWEDPQAYELQARKLASLFRERFTRFAGLVSAEVLAAGPQP